ncbi:MAG TPA: helix-turn-helix domain-containing protein, partial [Kofleriaceae bacterium]|nr:helix-turn-helix domain-containing protein [Kofleriaceae bacterium]
AAHAAASVASAVTLPPYGPAPGQPPRAGASAQIVPPPHAASSPAITIDAPPPRPAAPPPARSLRELEREGILAALAATNGNKAQAAAILEIDRSTLYKKLKDYDIDA